MSDTVKKIRESFELCISQTLPTFKKLDNQFDLEKNNFKNQKERYGVIALGGFQASGQVTTFLTVQRSFQVTLTNQYISTLNKDSNPQDALDILENAMDDILIKVTKSKVNNPGLVLQTSLESIDPPDFSLLENVVILRFNVAVSYRSPLAFC